MFSAGATGVPATTTNIVLDESYQTMDQNASSSSPAQNQHHNATYNMYNTGIAHSSASFFPRCESDSDFTTSQSGGEIPRLISPFFPGDNSQSDGESLGAIRRSGASDSEDYNFSFRKINLTGWAQPGGGQLSSNNSNDVRSVGSRDRQWSLSGDSGYYLSQDSVMATEDDMTWDRPLMPNCLPEPDIPTIMCEFEEYWGLLPTTSNPNPPQPPQTVIEENHQGEVAREVRVIISRGIWAFILSSPFFFFFNIMPMKTVYNE